MGAFFFALAFLFAFINGANAAPNAIVGCIATRSMTPKRALIMAGLFNFLGAIIMFYVSRAASVIVKPMFEFLGGGALSLKALCVGMCAALAFELVTLRIGIPTNEGYALMSGMTGVQMALTTSKEVALALNGYWVHVIFGLLISTIPTFFLSRLFYAILQKLCTGIDRRRAINYFMRTQKIGAAGEAFMYGVQGSQQSVGTVLLGLLIMSGSKFDNRELSNIAAVISATAMSMGVIFGGSRVIKRLGEDIVRLDAAGATASEGAVSFVLSLCTFFGAPVSVAHSKACAIMGIRTKKGTALNRGAVIEILIVWLLTFPLCALLGFLLGVFIL